MDYNEENDRGHAGFGLSDASALNIIVLCEMFNLSLQVLGMTGRSAMIGEMNKITKC